MGFVYCNPSLLSSGLILIWALCRTARQSLCCSREINTCRIFCWFWCLWLHTPCLSWVLKPFVSPDRRQRRGWSSEQDLMSPAAMLSWSSAVLAVQRAQFQLPRKSVPAGQMAILLCAQKAFSTEFIAILNLKHCDTCQKNSAACSLGQFFHIYIYIYAHMYFFNVLLATNWSRTSIFCWPLSSPSFKQSVMFTCAKNYLIWEIEIQLAVR